MSAEDDEDFADDMMFLALVLSGAYVLYTAWRNAQTPAGAPGQLLFQPTPPPPNTPTENVLNILVPRELSPNGENFIKKMEGFTATPNKTGDIGYGHHIQPGDGITPPITQQEAQALFEADTASFSQAVGNALKVQVSQDQFDALVSLAYNIGAAAFANSTLLRLLNQGDYAGAAQQFQRWVYSEGQINPTLQSRRMAETNLFSS